MEDKTGLYKKNMYVRIMKSTSRTIGLDLKVFKEINSVRFQSEHLGNKSQPFSVQT